MQQKLFGLEESEQEESVAAFEERLRSESRALQTPVTRKVVLYQFKGGLASRFQDQTLPVKENLDAVVSTVSKRSSA